MSKQNGQPFSHKQHAIALQGQLHDLQRSFDALGKAGTIMETRMQEYIRVICVLMTADGKAERVLSPDDHDKAYIQTAFKVHIGWEREEEGGSLNCRVKLYSTNPKEQAELAHDVEAAKESARQHKALEETGKPKGPRLLGPDGEPL